MNKSKLSSAIALALGASLSMGNANAALETIVVTATKRSESMQDVPVSVQALNGQAMKNLGVATFGEYIKFLPNVVQQGSGPGRNEIYIRGAAVDAINISVSSVQGSAPQVALYLDEQPVAFGGRNLDIYAADLERVEVLAGPQGTLFGASSQSGTLRLITNKPVLGETQAGVSAGFSSTSGGDLSSTGEAYVNLPLSENTAVRAVVYSNTQGGWIDNKPGSFNPDDSQLINVVNRNQISLGSSTILPDAEVIRPSNDSLVEENFNDASYTGARLSLKHNINDDWDVLVQHSMQRLETDGAFAVSPVLGDSSSQIYSPDTLTDEFNLTTWTVEGRVGQLDLIYTGGYLDREVSNITDYTLYTFGGGYQAYYLGSPFSYGGGADTLHDFRKQYQDNTTNERTTHELRIQSDPENRFSYTAGIFIDEMETNSSGHFQYFGAVGAGFDVAVTPGGGGSIATDIPRQGVGNPGARGASTIFVNDFTRNEDQIAFFGELKFDITDALSMRLGLRRYDLDFQFQGATGSSFGCKNVDPSTLPASRSGNGAVAAVRPDGSVGCDGNSFDNHVTQRLINLGQSGTVTGLGADGVANQSDTIPKVSFDYRVNPDLMVFATYSEGFRPQVANRNAGVASGNQTGVFEGYAVPAIASTDELSNFEVGMKGDFLDGTLRLNATYYNSEITDLQSARFDPSNIAFLVFIENVGDADIQGIDLDYQWAATDKLTISGAASFVDSEITRLNAQLEGVAVPVGSELPYTSDFSFNVRARYNFNWESMGADAYVQGALAHTGDSKAGIVGNAYFAEDVTRRIYGQGSGLQIANEGGTFGASRTATNLPGTFGLAQGGQFFQNGRYVQESYTLVNVAAGFNKDNLGVELYVNNLFDESGVTHVSTFDYTPTVAVTRPRTVGIRMNYDF
ncbi:MAG TPA: TonB-dependent receptor [Gammaproteobacteria bacterium]|nr:TonB-dependent receptor [Gammaproteobacteria bacterium]